MGLEPGSEAAVGRPDSAEGPDRGNRTGPAAGKQKERCRPPRSRIETALPAGPGSRGAARSPRPRRRRQRSPAAVWASLLPRGYRRQAEFPYHRGSQGENRLPPAPGEAPGRWSGPHPIQGRTPPPPNPGPWADGPGAPDPPAGGGPAHSAGSAIGRAPQAEGRSAPLPSDGPLPGGPKCRRHEKSRRIHRYQT